LQEKKQKKNAWGKTAARPRETKSKGMSRVAKRGEKNVGEKSREEVYPGKDLHNALITSTRITL